MEIYNEQFELLDTSTIDETKGKIVPRTQIIHHEYVAPIEAVWHYETIATYPNGGQDVEKVIDVPGVEEVLEHDENIVRMVFVPYTEKELAELERIRNEPTLEERLKKLTEENEMLIECVLEMSQIIYQ